MDQKDIRNKNCYEYGCDDTSDDEFGCGKDKPNPKILEAVRQLIIAMGDNPDRAGLKRTPIRVARAYMEWFGGYGIDPKKVLNRTFPSEGYDDMAVLRDISFDSHCEHHITPFSGVTHIGIVYGNKITGLDKFVKLVDVFARRLQTQEVMTQQIGEAIKDALKPKGIMVVVEAKHHCVGSRETKNKTTEFITTYRYGLFKTRRDLEGRFLQYIR